MTPPRTTPSRLEVRQVGGDDWENWHRIRLRSLDDSPSAFGSTLEREQPFTEADLRGRLDSPGPSVLVFADGTPVGIGAAFEDLPGWLHVVAMWVDPAWRGLGVSRRILDEVVGWATERRLRVHLDVTVGNDRARAAYESYGFVGTGETEPLREGSADVLERMVLPTLGTDVRPG